MALVCALSERTEATIALGSNLGNCAQILRDAFARLAQLSVMPLRCSSIWRSTPLDCPPGSPDFINAVVALTPLPHFTPEGLLTELQAMEREFGRRPKQVLNEARPLDLDLIAWGSEVRNTPTLTLPHPRAHLRRFVLQPLSELAPGLMLPGQMHTVAELLASLRTEEVLERLP
jgi:2-amino-4-hydroxy-6-hydroxymethyldihydropteridine diphosphokinase